MVYSITNYEELNNLYFHDDELDSILLDYKSKKAQLKLLKNTEDHHGDILLVFSEVTDLHIPLIETWGSGFYVNSVEVEKENNKLKTKILLNSSDEISLISETIKYSC